MKQKKKVWKREKLYTFEEQEENTHENYVGCSINF